MAPEIGPEHPLRRLFDGMLQETFMVELGVCDPRLTDYLGELLVDFLHVDRIYRYTDVAGRPLRDPAEIAALADTLSHGQKPQTRDVHRYLGDLALFWVGVYPENFRRKHRDSDRLRLCLAQGKHGYRVASELSQPKDHPPAELLRKLCEEFECCAHGLHLVREHWGRMAG